MATYEITDDFAIDTDSYWSMFFAQDYNDALWPHLQIRCEVLEFRRQGTGADETIHRVQRLTPSRELPALLQKLVSGAISYSETNAFSRKTNTIEVQTVPSFLADKLITRGTYRLVEVGPKQVRRVWQGRCECSIPLIGRKVEEFIIDEVRRSYAATTAFTRRWIVEHPA